MWIFIILLCLFLWFVLQPLLRVRRAIKNAQHRANDYFRGAYGGATGGQGQTSRRRNRTHKKIDPGVGEYVEFEELKVYQAPSTAASPGPDFTPEPQIEDADWEEIK